jgi:hypothetical protein
MSGGQMHVDFNTKGDFDPAHDIPSHSGDSNPTEAKFLRCKCNLCGVAAAAEQSSST